MKNEMVASTTAPPSRLTESQPNSDGIGLGGTDDTTESEEDEEVYPKVSKVKMTPRGGRHEPYERKKEENNNNNKPTSKTANAAKLATNRLYVGNLSYSVTWRELKDVSFSKKLVIVSSSSCLTFCSQHHIMTLFCTSYST